MNLLGDEESDGEVKQISRGAKVSRMEGDCEKEEHQVIPEVVGEDPLEVDEIEDSQQSEESKEEYEPEVISEEESEASEASGDDSDEDFNPSRKSSRASKNKKSKAPVLDNYRYKRAPRETNVLEMQKNAAARNPAPAKSKYKEVSSDFESESEPRGKSYIKNKKQKPKYVSDGSADSEGWHVKRSKQPVKAAKKPARKAINSDSETSSSEEESIDGSEASDEFLASDDGVEEIAKPVRRSAVLDQFLARKSEKGLLEDYFLIKFKGMSYKHVEWISYTRLFHEFDAKVRINNFLKREAEGKIQFDFGLGEFFNPDYLEIERIISHRDVDSTLENSSIINNDDILNSSQSAIQMYSNFDYLVLWKSQRYAEATWESFSECKDDLVKIEQYFMRNQLPSILNVNKRTLGADSASKMEFKNGNQLRPYQLEGLTWLAMNYLGDRNVILADEMGLGKTVQAVSFMNWLVTVCGCRGPFLVCAPLSTLPHWQREVDAWTELNAIRYLGDNDSRNIALQHEFKFPGDRRKDVFKFNILITTPEILMKDATILSGIPWKAFVSDEAQRLKNFASNFYQILYTSFNFDYILLMSGTPLQNSVDELWSLLHFLDMSQFPSLEEFKMKYGNMADSAQVSELQNEIRPYMLRRLKGDVEKNLPGKEETLIEVELTSLQKKYYKAIFEKNVAILADPDSSKSKNLPSLMNVAMQLRKCCNHPYTLQGVEEIESNLNIKSGSNTHEMQTLIDSCGKMVLLDKLLPKLKSQGHKVLIFSQMVKVLDVLEDFIRYRNYGFERIDGSVESTLRQAAIDRFSRTPDKFIFLLCTRAGGVGINLTAADTVIIYDSDWNPQQDIQAQARCHRIGQTKQVKVYRLITRNSYEQQMFQKSNLKLGLDRAVLHSMSVRASNEGESKKQQMSSKEVEQLLKHGAYSLFNESDDKSAEFEADEIDKILERATVVKYDDDTAATNSFSKASYVAKKSDSDIQLDDPNFWVKLGLKTKVKVDPYLNSRMRSNVDRMNVSSKSVLVKRKVQSDESANDASEYSGSSESEESDLDDTSTNSKFNLAQRDRMIEELAKVGFHFEDIPAEVVSSVGMLSNSTTFSLNDFREFGLGYLKAVIDIYPDCGNYALVTALKPHIVTLLSLLAPSDEITVRAQRSSALALLNLITIDSCLKTKLFTSQLTKLGLSDFQNIERLYALRHHWKIASSFDGINLLSKDVELLETFLFEGVKRIEEKPMYERFCSIVVPFLENYYKYHDVVLAPYVNAKLKGSKDPNVLAKFVKNIVIRGLTRFSFPTNDTEWQNFCLQCGIDLKKYLLSSVQLYASEIVKMEETDSTKFPEFTSGLVSKVQSRQNLFSRLRKVSDNFDSSEASKSDFIEMCNSIKLKTDPDGWCGDDDFVAVTAFLKFGFGSESFKQIKDDDSVSLFKLIDIPKEKSIEDRFLKIFNQLDKKLKAVEKTEKKKVSSKKAKTNPKVTTEVPKKSKLTPKKVKPDVMEILSSSETDFEPVVNSKRQSDSPVNINLTKSTPSKKNTPKKIAKDSKNVSLPYLLPNGSGITVIKLGEFPKEDLTKLYPIGFTTTREFSSWIDPAVRKVYHSEVLKGPDGPRFRVSIEGSKTDSMTGSSPTMVWEAAFRKIKEVAKSKGIDVNFNFSKEEGFGFSDSIIASMIDELPNSKRNSSKIKQTKLNFAPKN